MLLPIDELIQLVKLVLVCWGGKLKPTPKRVKVRLGLTQGGDARCCGSGWGQERAWREAVVGRKMLHLSLPWFIVVMSVTFLCQKVGAEKTGRHMFFAIPIYLIQLYRKRKHFIYNCCSKKNVRDDKWGRGKRTHFGRAEKQIKLGVSARARVWVIPLFLHHPQDVAAPSCSPSSVPTKYGRFHTSWI